MSPLNYVRLSVMMFVQFFLWGAWYVAGPGYLSQIGFDGGDFGWMYSVGPIAGMISPFVVGMIADRFFATERVLGIMHLFGAAAMFAASLLMTAKLPGFLAEWRPEFINLLFFAHMLCFFPTLALTNTLAMHTMTNPEKQFPLIRVFGTIGWIAGNMILDLLQWGGSIKMFYLAAGSGLVMGIYSFTLPHTPPPSAGKAVSVRQVLGLDALVLLKRPSYLAFMISSFLICIPLAFYYQIAFRTVDQAEIGPAPSIMSLGQWSEIGFMLVMPLFFARLGVKWMLFVGMLAWVTRYALFTVGAPDSIAWMLITGVVLHGICYDFFFVTGQIYTDMTASSEIRGQAQGMLVLFTLGLGMLIGAQVAGRVEVANTPPKTLWLQAEAGAVGEAVTNVSKELETLLAQDPSKKTAFEELRKQEASEAGEADKLRKKEFVALAEKETTSQEEALALAQKELEKLQADKVDATELKLAQDKVVELRKAKVEKLAALAGDFVTSEGAKISDAYTLHQRGNLLAAYQRAKSVEALKAMNWRMIWMIPAVFAGIIMVLFVFVFHDNPATRETDKAAAHTKPEK